MQSDLRACESLDHAAMMPRMLIFERLDTTDSTQREVLRRLTANAQAHQETPAVNPFGLWTTRQTQGMASHGRRWQDSPDGGLAISIAWPEQAAQPPNGAWPIRWSLMAVAALEASYPILVGRLGVKWPNDVIAEQSKLAGVLVTRHFAAGRWWWVAGVGINLAWRVAPEMGRPITDLRTLGVMNPDPETIVAALGRLANTVLPDAPVDSDDQWRQEYGRRDVAANKVVSVVHPVSGETLMSGINRGIRSTGELVLETHEGQKIVAIGELSLRFSSTAKDWAA